MIFTVGHTENYKAAIDEHGIIFKLGQTIEYEGCIVFVCYAHAKAYLEEVGKAPEWSVCGGDADWIMDTYPDREGWWSRLLFDAAILELDDN